MRSRRTWVRVFACSANAAAYVKWGMDTQEASLSDGQSPSEPHWGEEPRSSWGHIISGAERRQVPTLAGSYQLFYAGMATLLLQGGPPPVDIADAVITAEIVEAVSRSWRTGTVAALGM